MALMNVRLTSTLGRRLHIVFFTGIKDAVTFSASFFKDPVELGAGGQLDMFSNASFIKDVIYHSISLPRRKCY